MRASTTAPGACSRPGPASQVAWPMARGLPGAFGRAANAPWIWIALCVLFVAALRRARRCGAAPRPRGPARLLGLATRSSAPANVDVSVPIGLSRCCCTCSAALLWVAWHRPRRAAAPAAARRRAARRRSPSWSAFRVALNLVDGNVIDVGYAGVVGADRLLDGEPLYGAFPPDNRARRHLRPGRSTPPTCRSSWSGRGAGTWDDLPAAHAAASPSTSRCLGGLWLAGRRLGGPLLGLLLAYLWAAFPFTLLVAELGRQRRAGRRARPRARCSAPAGPVARGGARGARRPDEVRAARARAAVRDRGRAAAAALTRSRRRGGRRPASSRAASPLGAGCAVLRPHARLPGRPRARRSRSGAVRRPRGCRRSSPLAARGARRSPSRSCPRRRDDATRRRAGRGRADRGPARAGRTGSTSTSCGSCRCADRAAHRQAAGRSTGSIAVRPPRPAQRMSTALIHGSSSDGVVALRHVRAHDGDRLLAAHADHAAARAGHADVGDVGRAAGEHARVGGRHVRVRADDRGRPCRPGTSRARPSRSSPPRACRRGPGRRRPPRAGRRRRPSSAGAAWRM